MPEKGDQFDISEIIGMIIALLAILYSFGSSIYEVFRKRSQEEQKEESQTPDIYEELQRQEALIEEEEEEEFEEPEEVIALPPPPRQIPSIAQGRKPEEKFIFHTHLDEFKPTTAIDTRHLEIGLNRPESLVSHEVVSPLIEAPKPITTKKEFPIQGLLKRFGKKGELVIATEIILPPVGLRKLK